MLAPTTVVYGLRFGLTDYFLRYPAVFSTATLKLYIGFLIGVVTFWEALRLASKRGIQMNPNRKSLAQRLRFGIATSYHRLRFRWLESREGTRPQKFRQTTDNVPVGWHCIAQHRSSLWPQPADDTPLLTAGKIENLRRTVRALNGLTIPAGGVFSFWRHVGRPSRRRGFAVGREVRQGCIIPTRGGGLCQVSNTLYACVLDAQLPVIQRHGHTAPVAGSTGPDATLFWPYVDFRFQASVPLQIQMRLTATHFEVAFWAPEPKQEPTAEPIQAVAPNSTPRHLNNCLTCGQHTCAYHPTRTASRPDALSTAWLLDNVWPEYADYLKTHIRPKDPLFLPMNGHNWRRPAYAWPCQTGQIQSFPSITLQYAWRARRMPAQGRALQTHLLQRSDALAKAYAKALPVHATHLVVQQHLLPHLWATGALAGRTFQVLMTRLPLAELQRSLDAAAALYPDSPTLGDFRAPAALLEMENEALSHSQSIITPHTRLAALFPGRAELLPWHLPKRLEITPEPANPTPAIWFPASGLGRKGAYAIRELAKAHQIEIGIRGQAIEKPGFWDGLSVTQCATPYWPSVQVAVLPAFVEHAPRGLLRALAQGVPVIASTACGLGAMPGVTEISAENLPSFIDAATTMLIQPAT